MTTLFDTIVQIEKEWLKPIYGHIDSLFAGTHLPSHDADHHLRVWNNCRHLMLELNAMDVEIPTDTVKQCLVACFFHDTGLLKDVGENHGADSRILCQLFLADNPQISIEHTDCMLEAVEKHDIKSERRADANSLEEIVSTQRLVTTADDMDAFGYLGVFRYIEIYLKRGIPQERIPQKVIANLRGRFNNFWQSFSMLQPLVQEQRKRFNITLNFFTQLDAANNDHQLIFEILGKFIAQKKGNLIGFATETLNQACPPYVATFMEGLKNELEATKLP